LSVNVEDIKVMVCDRQAKPVVLTCKGQQNEQVTELGHKDSIPTRPRASLLAPHTLDWQQHIRPIYLYSADA